MNTDSYNRLLGTIWSPTKSKQSRKQRSKDKQQKQINSNGKSEESSPKPIVSRKMSEFNPAAHSAAVQSSMQYNSMADNAGGENTVMIPKSRSGSIKNVNISAINNDQMISKWGFVPRSRSLGRLSKDELKRLESGVNVIPDVPPLPSIASLPPPPSIQLTATQQPPQVLSGGSSSPQASRRSLHKIPNKSPSVRSLKQHPTGTSDYTLDNTSVANDNPDLVFDGYQIRLSSQLEIKQASCLSKLMSSLSSDLHQMEYCRMMAKQNRRVVLLGFVKHLQLQIRSNTQMNTLVSVHLFNDKRRFLKQLGILAEQSNRRLKIAQLLGYYLNDKASVYGYITPMKSCTLRQFLECRRNVSGAGGAKDVKGLIEPGQILLFIKDIASALNALHSMGISHGLLTPTSIGVRLVSTSGGYYAQSHYAIYFDDFDYCAWAHETDVMKELQESNWKTINSLPQASIPYLAPEILSNCKANNQQNSRALKNVFLGLVSQHHPYSLVDPQKADIYSFGMVAYYMLELKDPFGDLINNRKKFINKVLEGFLPEWSEPRTDLIVAGKTEILGLIESCWHEVNLRLNAKLIVDRLNDLIVAKPTIQNEPGSRRASTRILTVPSRIWKADYGLNPDR